MSTSTFHNQSTNQSNMQSPKSITLPPQKFRELLFLALFSQESIKLYPDDVVQLLSTELKVAKSQVRKAVDQAVHIKGRVGSYDTLIKDALIDWDLDRIHATERVILWIALYELIDEKKHSPKIIISEAKRLAKKFSVPKAAQFVHAIIAKIGRKFSLLEQIDDEMDLKVVQTERDQEEKIEKEFHEKEKVCFNSQKESEVE